MVVSQHEVPKRGQDLPGTPRGFEVLGGGTVSLLDAFYAEAEGGGGGDGLPPHHVPGVVWALFLGKDNMLPCTWGLFGGYF